MIPKTVFISLLGLCLVGIAVGAQSVHEAARDGNLDGLRSIVERNPEAIGSRDEVGRTPLHWAARGVHFEVIEFLLLKGADVNATDNMKIMPLHSVAYRGHGEAARLLIEYGADIHAADETGQTPLSYAMSGGHREMVDLLVSHGVSTPDDPQQKQILFQQAVSGGHESLVHLLIERGAALPSAPEEINDLLHQAAIGGLPELFQLMIERGADTSSRNSRGGTLLHSAAGGGLLDIVVDLIADGAAINEKNRYGMTPLHIAALYGQTAVIDYLLSQGVNVNAGTDAGQTALFFAEQSGREDAIIFLRSKGAGQRYINFPELHGPYLGQAPPGPEPQVFAPGIVSSIGSEHGTITFSPDGKEVFWSVLTDSGFLLHFMKTVNGRWTLPSLASFSSGEWSEGMSTISPDGKRLFFLSTRPLNEEDRSGLLRRWFVERTNSGWNEPRPMDEVFQGGYLGMASVTNQGRYYFVTYYPDQQGKCDIYVSEMADGWFSEPQALGEPINTDYDEMDFFIDPDERYLIFCSDRPGGYGSWDLYISFRQRDGSWGAAINMGDRINSASMDRLPFVTADEKHLFFMSDRDGNQDIFWMEAGVIGSWR